MPKIPQVEGEARPLYVAISPPREGGMGLAELWLVLWRGKWLIFALATFCAVAGVVYSLSLTPIYRAEVVLAPVKRNPANSLGDLGGLASLAGIRLGSSDDSSYGLAIFRSHNFIAEYIEENDLLPILFKEEWDSKNHRWLSEDPEQQRDVRDGVKLFVENIRSISEDPQTGLVTLGIEWTDPVVARNWAMGLVERVNRITRERDIEESRRKLNYLNEELAKASLVELRTAISRVIEEQISGMMLAQAQVEYAFEVIDPPVVPKQRSRPKRTIIVIVATIMGGFLGSFIALGSHGILRMRRSMTASGV